MSKIIRSHKSISGCARIASLDIDNIPTEVRRELLEFLKSAIKKDLNDYVTAMNTLRMTGHYFMPGHYFSRMSIEKSLMNISNMFSDFDNCSIKDKNMLKVFFKHLAEQAERI